MEKTKSDQQLYQTILEEFENYTSNHEDLHEILETLTIMCFESKAINPKKCIMQHFNNNAEKEIEALNTANEALKTANEALQTANKVLKTANEDLKSEIKQVKKQIEEMKEKHPEESKVKKRMLKKESDSAECLEEKPGSPKKRGRPKLTWKIVKKEPHNGSQDAVSIV